ncbi:hypothetical protein AB1L88_24115 [Tautonia sp. JC769]|uniref:hypothetical protein n=1 Tax=Tautonia sp. JC769 TaxID=3232135 RepID=UPI003457F6C3
MPETSQARSGTTRLLQHPLVLPTLFVLGGWGLLLGGYLPARSPAVPASADAPGGPRADRGDAAPPPARPGPRATARPTVSAIIGERSASESGPIRLTIEFPGGLTGSAVVTASDRESTEAIAPESRPEPRAGAGSQRRPAPRDSEILRARAAEVMEPVVPPPIPGPPPAFDPAVLSPLIPESVPDAPLFDRDGDAPAGALIARPMGDLPEAFDPGPLLDRYRGDGRSERTATVVASGVEPTAGVVDRGDQAPEPPAVPRVDSDISTAPEILPEPSIEPEPSTPPDGLQPAGLHPRGGGGPVRPIQHPQPPQYRGLKRLFRAYLPPPPVPLVPPPTPRHPTPESDAP